jgi:hypothetical protein
MTVEEMATRYESLRRAASEAISELRRWQDADDPADVSHSIDSAIHILERA